MTQNEWDEYASDWDSNDDVQVYATKAFESWRRKVIPLAMDMRNGRLLDFGCGTGLLTEKLAPLCGQILAVDTSAKMIDVLRKKISDTGIENVTALELTVNAAAISERPELDGKFDLIVASSVCSFLPDYETTLNDLACLLNPGGVFVQWDWLADLSVERIRKALDASGLNDVSVEQAFSIDTDNEPMQVVMGIGRLPT